MNKPTTIENAREPIAIIGMAGIFPKAESTQAFWQNIVAEVDAIGDPGPAWEADRYLRSNRIDTAKGGYLKELYTFDPVSFGIMPGSMDGCEPDHFIALRIAREALVDAGYAPDSNYDHRDTGIIIGHSTYLHRGQANHIQHHIILDQTIELMEALFPSMKAEQREFFRALFQKKLPQSNADNAPGLVPNVMTGRIANRLNLKGPNYIVDGACASSLLAVNAAMDELRGCRSRLMLAGGINASLPAEATVIFSQLGALSKSGSIRPFSEFSDGTLLGEGAGMLVLKRLSDASKDGDRVYAVIRGMGIASDGKALGLLAPNIDGEILAIARAYEESGIDPLTVALVEAHGTGIPLGDETEIKALKEVFGDCEDGRHHIALGSVKSMIGHCIPAAGIAGLIKSAMALHHRIMPPTLCGRINPNLCLDRSPFFINTDARPWISNGNEPRRAAVNAFGFGGINSHAILEEAPPSTMRPLELSAWPFELCIFSGQEKESLIRELKKTLVSMDDSFCLPLCDVAARLIETDDGGNFRLAIVAKDKVDLKRKLDAAISRLRESKKPSWSTRNGIVCSSEPIDGKMAFMFPGEGSQYIGMFSDLAMYFEEVRQWLGFWNGLYGDPRGKTRVDIVYPLKGPVTERFDEKQTALLHSMDIGSEAVFIASQAMNALLDGMGVQPDVMVGHSTGESSALAASGAMAFENFDQLGSYIKRLNKVYRRILSDGEIATGILLSVGALSQGKIETHLSEYAGRVEIAMDNCLNQQILFGMEEDMKRLTNSLKAAGGICMELPFDRGYHTHWFSTWTKAFLKYYEDVKLTTPKLSLYSCAIADRFPDDKDGVRKLAAEQWSVRVRFRETIKRMYEEGVRYFVEVGPSGHLCSFINDILSGKAYLSIPTNLRHKNDLQQFLFALAQLYVNRKEVQLQRLFSRRAVTLKDKMKSNTGQSRSRQVVNTMPVVHFDHSEIKCLREALLRGECGVGTNNTTDRLPGGRAILQEQEETRRQFGDDVGVMDNYFSLMHQFLDQQCDIMKFLGQPLGDVPLTSRKERCSPSDDIPFLNSVEMRDEHQIQATCHLNVREHNFLRHHILSGPVSGNDANLLGLSCVPMMVSLEIMAEACSVLNGSRDVVAIENIKATTWIALDGGEANITVSAKWSAEDANRIHAHLVRDGLVAVAADFLFDTSYRILPLKSLVQKRRFKWNGQQLYKIGMFHGPIFRSIRQVEGWNEDGIDAFLTDVKLENFLSDNHTPAFVLNPVLLDAIGQLSANWIAQRIGTDFNCFPSSIGRIEILAKCPQGMEGLILRARQRPILTETDLVEVPRSWNFECIDGEGNALLRVENMTNIFFSVPHSFYEVRLDPLNGKLGKSIKELNDESLTIWRVPHFQDSFYRQSNGIFFNILAHVFLTEEEKHLWRELDSNRRVQIQWFMGRACIKEAVRFWIYKQFGKLLYATDIRVYHDQLGAPFVGGWWQDRIAPPEISLSHNKYFSVVAVSPAQHFVGIDVERIDHLSKADLIKGALGEEELMALQEFSGEDLKQRSLRIWCAKEAAAKYLGTGLKGAPKVFQVSFLDKDWRKAQVMHNEEIVNVAVDRIDESIMAISTPSLF